MYGREAQVALGCDHMGGGLEWRPGHAQEPGHWNPLVVLEEV